MTEINKNNREIGKTIATKVPINRKRRLLKHFRLFKGSNQGTIEDL